MRLILYGYPTINDITIFINDRKGSTGKFYACGDIRFRNFNRSRLIFLYGFQFDYRDILSLVRSVKGKDFIGRYKSGRRCQFFHIIFAKRQVERKGRLAFPITGYRLKQGICCYDGLITGYDIFCIVKPKLGPLYNRSVFGILLLYRDADFLPVVGEIHCLRNDRSILSFIDKFHFF